MPKGHLLNSYLAPWGPPGTKAVLGLASSESPKWKYPLLMSIAEKTLDPCN